MCYHNDAWVLYGPYIGAAKGGTRLPSVFNLIKKIMLGGKHENNDVQKFDLKECSIVTLV